MIQLPRPEIYRDVVVGPMLPGSNKRKLSFQVFPFDTPIRQIRRLAAGELGDVAARSAMQVEDVDKAIEVDGPTLYAGPYLRHFGHFVAECIHRLYARSQFESLKTAKVVFHGIGWKPNPIEPWLPGVLDLCGVPISDVLIIDRPTRFSELHVPTQARILGGTTIIEGYSSFFPPRQAEADADPVGNSMIYLTRSKHIFSGSYLGETLVERILNGSGFDVISPEDFTAPEIVKRLRGARFIVASEGSSIHNLELCGRVAAGVVVIGRRKGTQDRFRDILTAVSSNWRIVEEIIDAGVPLDWDAGMRRPSWQRACSLLDIGRVVQEIASFTGLTLRAPEPAEVKAAMASDLATYILDGRSTRAATTNEQLGELLRSLRAQWAKVNSAPARP